MDNPFLLGAETGEESTQPNNLQLAIVAGIYEDGLSLIPDAQAEPTQKHYKYLTSAYPAPAVGDRVVIMKMSGTYVVMGALGVSASLPAANTVYAGPASGDAAAAAFRSLVAADLPVVPINKGGSGQSGVSITQDASEIVTASEGWAVTSAIFGQWGKLAMIRIDIKTTQQVTIGTDTTIAQIASGKRPAVTSPAQAWLSSVYHALITANGALHVGRSSSATVAANVGFTFLAVYLLA